jgi:hypothetical protein
VTAAAKLNRRMQRWLDELRSREVEAGLPARGPEVKVVEAGGCFLLAGFVKKPHLSPADFPDATGLECSANKLRMETLFSDRIAALYPLLLLTAGLVTARTLAAELARHPSRFNVIVSFDGDSCAVRFHKIRAGERWLLEDLEDYAEEGVLVFEAGPEAPLPALLMARAEDRP